MVRYFSLSLTLFEDDEPLAEKEKLVVDRHTYSESTYSFT